MAYAGEIGVEHFVQQATADISLQLLNDVVAACSEPFADYSIFPTLLVSRLAREQVKVMLSGDGGDELFWGYADRLSSVLGKLPSRLNGVGSAERNSEKWSDPGIGMIPDVVPARPFVSAGISATAIRRYQGLKENVYLSDFRPAKNIRVTLGISKKQILVTFRLASDLT